MNQRRLFTIAVAALTSGCGRLGYDLLPAPLGGTNGTGASSTLLDGAAGGLGGSGGGAPVTDGSTSGGAGGTGGAPVADCTGTVPGVEDPCTSLPALPVAPVIDGLPDCSLSTTFLAPLGFAGDAGSPDAVARYAAAVRPDGLYVYVVVTDSSAIPAAPTDPADHGDAVEIYLDSNGTFASPPAYDDPGTRRFVIAAPSDGAPFSTRGEVWTDARQVSSTWSSKQFQAKSQSFGYVVEAFVRAEDLGVASLDFTQGHTLGWNLAVDVSYATPAETGSNGHRRGRYFLHLGPSGSTPVTDVGAFCTPTVL